MAPREIAARVAYKAYVAYERAQFQRGAFTDPGRLRHALAPSHRGTDWEGVLVARRHGGRFFASLDAAETARSAFRAFADEHARARAIADDVALGRIGFFGHSFEFSEPIDWHADPVTKAAWPKTFHADVPVSGGNIGFGDVKDVWEINRHQFFVDLAKVALLDSSRRHADALHRLLRDWMAHVPYGTGAAWACALEPAFRVWSWMWAYHMVRAAGLVDRDTHLLWLTGFFDHGRFLHRHLEVYSSPYNHLIGEASALFALGVLFPEFAEAPAWRERGRHILESTVGGQFYADGGTVEQSTFYHHATLGFYLLSAILGRQNGIELSPSVWAAIERGIDFSATLIQPDGRLPRIGGADDGKPIRLEHLPFWDFRPYQAIGAVLFARPDFRFVATRFWEDAFWLLGPDAMQTFEQLAPRAPQATRALPTSGYYVARSDWSAEADFLCFDCGEQAAGLRRDDVPSAAHGHADCLSVIVSLGGREVLVDPGFFCYNGEPAWEVQFRKTALHNTVQVDGRDQAQHLSKMAWARTYLPSAEGWSDVQQIAWARGSHDGYARSPAPLTHRRTAWLRRDGYVVLLDELSGTRGHQACAVFQFAPGELTSAASSVLFDGRYELAWACSSLVEAAIARGGPSPADGWVATSLGVRQPAPRLALRFAVDQPRVVLLTLIADRRRVGRLTETRVHIGRAADGVLRAEVRGDDWTDDVVAAAGASSAASQDIDTDAPLTIARRAGDGRIADVFHAGGSYARCIDRRDSSSRAAMAAASVN
jgi:hypothetical protein